MEYSDYREHYRLDGEIFHFEEETESPHREANRRLGQQMLGLARLKEDERILDVGCGSGWLLAALSRSGVKQLYGIDLSRAQYFKGSRDRLPGGVFLEGDAYFLPFGDKSMDAVIMSEILEHLERPDVAIKDAARVLKPGGRLLVTVPAREKIRYTLCIHCNRKTPVSAHLHAFDIPGLKALLEQAGLDFSVGINLLNKALVAARVHLLLRMLPYSAWRVIDKTAGLFLDRWTNICTRADKSL